MMAMFNSYVQLPEGEWNDSGNYKLNNIITISLESGYEIARIEKLASIYRVVKRCLSNGWKISICDLGEVPKVPKMAIKNPL